MQHSLNRRAFLRQSLAAAGAAAVAGCTMKQPDVMTPAAAPRKAALRKALCWGMLPGNLSIADRFQLARDCGFAGIEANTTPDPNVAAQLCEAASRTGVRIHSVMNDGHWGNPLSSSDPAVVAKGVTAMMTSLRNAKEFGADTVLLVPAVVNPKTSYADAYSRSTVVIRERILPEAEKLGVVVAVENVWNKFLLSPLEFKQYVDQFKSRCLRAYFDCGNIIAYGYPQDWIRTLGPRIAKIHVKDFDAGKHAWRNLLDGSVDWKEVRTALDEIGYDGFMTAELPGGDEKYLRDVSERMSRIIAG